MDSPPVKLKTDTSQSDDPMAQTMSDPMLLGTSVLPFLNGTELARSAEVSTVWKRTQSDRLWKALAVSEWPDMMKSLMDAGALDQTTFRDFYLRRKKPAVKKAPSLSEDDELFVLIDMPNLVKVNEDGTGPAMPLQPLHRMFPLVPALRMNWDHQRIFEETTCSCRGEGCAHPSSWLHFPLTDEVFRPNLDTVNSDSPDEEVFRLDVSIIRKSDGKVVKVIQSTSSQCEAELPDSLGAPWATFKHEYGCPPNHMAGQSLRVTAGLEAENLHPGHDAYYESDGNVAFDELKFSLQHIVLGLEVYDQDEMSYTYSMVPMDSVDKVDMFLDMIRLQWA
jgi:hypothetical protein